MLPSIRNPHQENILLQPSPKTILSTWEIIHGSLLGPDGDLATNHEMSKGHAAQPQHSPTPELAAGVHGGPLLLGGDSVCLP